MTKTCELAYCFVCDMELSAEQISRQRRHALILMSMPSDVG